MASTAVFAFPYPALTDTPDVARDVKALADRIEAVQVSEKVLVVNQSGSAILTAAAQNAAGITLPVGQWLVKCSGQFDVSITAGTTRDYTARIANPTVTLLNSTYTLIGTMKTYVYLELEITVATPVAVSLQVFATTTGGSQGFSGGKFIAQPIAY